jgi:hypothetical protein
MYHFFVRVFGASISPTNAAPLTVSFETALERLALLPDMFTEPDGSFVWRSHAPEATHWQVDGNLFDRGDTLFYVELKGCCPAAQFQQLLECWSNSGDTFTFEWVERGLLMNEKTFRQIATNSEFTQLPHGD